MKTSSLCTFSFLIAVTTLPYITSANVDCGNIIERFDDEEYVSPIEDCENPFSLNDDPQFENIIVENDGVLLDNGSVLSVDSLPITLDLQTTYDRILPEPLLSPAGPVFEFYELYQHSGDDYIFSFNSLTITEQGTYTLVVSLEEAPVLSWFDQVQSWLITTAHAQQPPASGERLAITFTVAVVEEPAGASSVLFLPGIQASRLYAGEDIVLPGPANNIEAGDKLWEQTNDKRIAALRMNEQGESVYDIYTADVLDEVGLGTNIYKGFLDLLENMKSTDTVTDGKVIQDYSAFAYDWRYSVFDIATTPVQYETETKLLKDELLTLASSSYTKKVTIVAHSNGGLVAKALLEEYGDNELAGKVDKVIMIGTPQLGTPKSINALLHGQILEGFANVLTADAVMRDTVRNMPGVYTLLPSGRYFDEVLDQPLVNVPDGFDLSVYNDVKTPAELRSLLLDTANVVGSNPAVYEPAAVNEQLLAEAQTEQAVLDAWQPPEGVEVYEVVGTGIATPAAVTYEPVPAAECSNAAAVFLAAGCTITTILKPKFLFSTAGDKTVIAGSAAGQEGDKVTAVVNLAEEGEQRFTLQREHADLTESPVVQTFVESAIRYPYVGDSITVPEFTDVTTRYTIHAAHSPVSLRAVTNDGLVTGPGDDVLREEIPGSQYLTLSGSSYIVIPDTVTDYTLEIIGTENGVYTLETSELTEDTEQTVVRGFVASTTDTMRATMQIIDGNVGDLTTDFDGDGTIDEVRTADGKLVEEHATKFIRFAARDIDRTLPGGDKRREFVADVYEDDVRVDTVEIARKINRGGRVKQVISNSDITVTSYKTKRAFPPAIGNQLSATKDSKDLRQDKLRYTQGFSIGKPGNRKHNGILGDKGKRKAKDNSWRKMLLFDASQYLSGQSINSVQLDVRHHRTDTFSGQLLVLAPREDGATEYTIVDVMPLQDIGAGATTIDLTTPGTALALHVLDSSLRIGVSLKIK